MKVCAIYFMSLAAGALAAPQDAPPQTKPVEEPAAAMQESLAKQRLSIQRQMQSVTHAAFFMLPPPSPIASDILAAEECEPLADDQLQRLIDEASHSQSVQPDLLRSVIRQESGARPCAVSAKGAEGLMQLMPATSQQFGVTDPFDPHQNVQAGARLLKQLLTRYGGDVSKALAAYNAGTSRVDQAGAVPQIPETVNYVSSILASLPH